MKNKNVVIVLSIILIITALSSCKDNSNSALENTKKIDKVYVSLTKYRKFCIEIVKFRCNIDSIYDYYYVGGSGGGSSTYTNNGFSYTDFKDCPEVILTDSETYQLRFNPDDKYNYSILEYSIDTNSMLINNFSYITNSNENSAINSQISYSKSIPYTITDSSIAFKLKGIDIIKDFLSFSYSYRFLHLEQQGKWSVGWSTTVTIKQLLDFIDSSSIKVTIYK